MTDRRLLGGLCLLLAVPWTILLPQSGRPVVVLAWGLLNPETLHVATIVDYVFRYTQGPLALPDYLLAWPVSVGLYALAVANVVRGTIGGLEDVRVTTGLLLLASFAHLTFGLGFANRGYVVVPLGSILLALLAWWRYTLAAS